MASPNQDQSIRELLETSSYQMDPNIHAQYLLMALATNRGMSSDAAETLTRQLGNELVFQKARLIRTEFGPLKVFTSALIPMAPEPSPPGATTSRYTRFTEFGMAELVATCSDDWPKVDGGVEDFEVPLVTLGICYETCIEDSWRSELQMVKKLTELPRAAQQAHSRKQNEIGLIGIPELGFGGLVNQANIPVVAVSTGSWDLVGTTPEQIVNDLLELEESIIEGTLENHFPDLLLVTALIMRALQRPYSTGTEGDSSIWDVFVKRSRRVLENRPGTWRVVVEGALVDAGGIGIDRVLMYEASPDVLELDIAVLFTELAPVQGVGKIKVPTASRMAVMQMIIPLAAAYSENAFS